MGTRFASDGRPLPQPTPVSQPFFDAARAGRLVLPRCPRDGFFFYPRSRCPRCLGAGWRYEPASGRGTVHAFTIDRVGHDPSLRREAPFAIAVVELAEGPRMTARIVGCDPADVRVGLPVEVCFEAIEDATLVRFRPCADAARGGI